MNLPVSGVWEFDYVSTAKAPLDSTPATDAQVSYTEEYLRLLAIYCGRLQMIA